MKRRLIQVGLIAVLGFTILNVAFWSDFQLYEKVVTYIAGCICLIILVIHTSAWKQMMPYIRGGIWSFKLNKSAEKLRVGEKVQFIHPECITIGKNCDVSQNVVFAPLKEHHGIAYPSRIVVGDNVHFGSFDRIASMNEVRIDNNVLFAAFVHVTDHSHQYTDVNLPVSKQGVYSKGPVHIKEGAWLAFGCHILSGVTIGKNSVVAANSVVTKDVPDYTVVAGNPAKAISQYNFKTRQWEKINGNGQALNVGEIGTTDINWRPQNKSEK